MIQLACFSLFKQIATIVAYGLIALIIVICLSVLLKSDNGKKFVFYIVTGLIIISSIICGVQLYKEITAKSYINGQIDIRNQFITQSFEYKSSSVVFTKSGENEAYTFEIDLTKVEDFNGEIKQYKIEMNDYILFNAVITTGSVSADVEIDFYDTQNKQVCTSELNILVEFLSNKTRLKMTTQGAKQAEFLTQYFTDYGIRLSIAELKGDIT